MPMSPEELARRRVANQAAHLATRQAHARTPMERAAVAWERWRGLLRDLPAGQADPWAEAITTTLNAQSDQLTQILNTGDR